jgi:DNA end-binding protein Ku
LRNKASLAILKPDEKVIVLMIIRFSEEIRDISDLNLPGKTEVKGNELKMAVSLIDDLSAKFDVGKYKDDYSAELMKLIKAKAKGKKIQMPKMKVVHSKTTDLMAQLKASLKTKHKKAS